MSGYPILDVAIGLVFVYLLLSMICTTLNEGIQTQLRARAKYLDKGILALLGSDIAKKAFFEHPIIQSYRNPTGDSVLRKIGRRVGWPGAEDDVDRCPSYLSAFAFARAVHDRLRDPVVGTIKAAMVKDAAEGNTAKHPELSQTLRAVLADANSAQEELKLLKQWYNDGMERVSGWYKRHAQAWVRVLAVIIAISLNADTVGIAKKLWQDPTTREKVVQAAISRSKNPPRAVNYPALDEATPDATTPDVVGTDTNQTVGAGQKSAGLTDTEKQVLGELVGWDKESRAREAMRDPKTKTVPWSAEWAIATGALGEHWMGWLLTAIAVSLGAPFWFDLLKKLINIRNAGSAPDEQEAKEKKDAA